MQENLMVEFLRTSRPRVLARKVAKEEKYEVMMNKPKIKWHTDRVLSRKEVIKAG